MGNLFDARGREWLEKYVKTRIHYLALLQIRKMSEGYILSIKDVEIYVVSMKKLYLDCL